MSGRNVCRHCKGELSNASQGDVSCTNCGRVHMENPIVSEVQFGETSSGAAMVQGSMISSDQVRARFNGRQNSMESNEQTLKNGKDKIKKIAAALRIQGYIAEMAGEWFNLALLKNFVQGRRSQNVLAACLYLACRTEKTHHLIIDFSSLLQISVYSLGASYLKLIKALNINKLPLADPSIFIQHFAEKLEFGSQVTKVVRDATKLAARMSDDWIHEGRRPAGIAGACVLIAARMNNFRRLHAEIVEVSHVAEETLQKRLNEFKKTNSGALTVQEIRENKEVAPMNPPSFAKNRLLELKIEKQIEENKANEISISRLYEETKPDGEVVEDDGIVVSEIEEAEKDKGNEKSLNAEKTDAEEVEKSADTTTSAVDGAEEQKQKVAVPLLTSREQKVRNKIMKSVLRGCELTKEEIETYCKRAIQSQSNNLTNSMYINPADRADSVTKKKEEIKENPLSVKYEMDDLMDRMVEMNRPRNLAGLLTTADILKDSDRELTKLEEDELDKFLLNEEEIKLKERVWTGLNQDFLIAQEKKRLKLEADELTGNTSGTTRKRRKRSTNKEGEGIGGIVGDDGVGGVANSIGMNNAFDEVGVDGNSGEPLTAADSAKRFLAKKSFSKKINYETLNTLF